jgi:hypothetical protein
MRFTFLCATLAASTVIMHCGATNDSNLIHQRISLIKVWQVSYTSTRDLSSVPWGESSPASSRGQVERNFNFAKLTSQVLRTSFGIRATEEKAASCGHIRITATEVPKGPPKYYDITLHDEDDQLLVRKRVLNDAHAMTETWSEGLDYQRELNNRLAAYVAHQIADLVAVKPDREGN